jgi:hypothetical protein
MQISGTHSGRAVSEKISKTSIAGADTPSGSDVGYGSLFSHWCPGKTQRRMHSCFEKGKWLWHFNVLFITPRALRTFFTAAFVFPFILSKTSMRRAAISAT